MWELWCFSVFGVGKELPLTLPSEVGSTPTLTKFNCCCLLLLFTSDANLRIHCTLFTSNLIILLFHCCCLESHRHVQSFFLIQFWGFIGVCECQVIYQSLSFTFQKVKILIWDEGMPFGSFCYLCHAQVMKRLVCVLEMFHYFWFSLCTPSWYL